MRRDFWALLAVLLTSSLGHSHFVVCVKDMNALVRSPEDEAILKVARQNPVIASEKANKVPEGYKMTLSMGASGRLGDRTYKLVQRNLINENATPFHHPNPFGLVPAVAEVAEDGSVKQVFMETESRWRHFKSGAANIERQLKSDVGDHDYVDKVYDYITHLPENQEAARSGRLLLGSKGPNFHMFDFTKINEDTWVIRVWGIIGASLYDGKTPKMRLYNSEFHVGATIIANKAGVLVLPDHDLSIEGLRELYRAQMPNIFDFVSDPDGKLKGKNLQVASIKDRSTLDKEVIHNYSPADIEVTMTVIEDEHKIGDAPNGGGYFPLSWLDPHRNHAFAYTMTQAMLGSQAAKQLSAETHQNEKSVHFFHGYYSSEGGLSIPKDSR